MHATSQGQPGAGATGPPDVEALAGFLAGRRCTFVLTGAGCSTESGIPDYRDVAGEWRARQPMRFAEFRGSAAARKRYWARSLVGWERIAAARPNAAHRALARLTATGWLEPVVTQNVDGLHQRAGSRDVIDLHGRLDQVECLECGAGMSRERFQQVLHERNPSWPEVGATHAPDGDADLGDAPYERFEVPECRCGGPFKPGVVFFGESVPRPRLNAALARLDAADGVLVVGSSLMVWSGYRFVREARRRGLPVAAVNLGRTRADAELTLRLAVPCGPTLAAVAALLAPGSQAAHHGAPVAPA